MKRLRYSAKRFSVVQDSDSVVEISPQACICCAAMILTVPFRWYSAWIAAAMMHELGHCAMVAAMGKRIHRVKIGAFSANIQTEPMPPASAMLCALAGPAAGLLLIPAARFAPRLAVCALVQTAFNLLPVYPLDGSVALGSFLALLFSRRTAEKIRFGVEIAVLLILLLACLSAAILWELGTVSAAFATLLLGLVVKRKIPCKYDINAVQ